MDELKDTVEKCQDHPFLNLSMIGSTEFISSFHVGEDHIEQWLQELANIYMNA
jgi:hypothetical protein